MAEPRAPLGTKIWSPEWGPSVRSQDGVWQNPIVFISVPFSQSDWPNPTRLSDAAGVATRAQASLSNDPNPTLLVGQDRIYAGPGQVPSYDWPNPRGTLHLVLQNPLNILALTSAAPAPPIFPINWPNPVRQQVAEYAALRASSEVWQDTLLNVLAGQDLLPFRKSDWPNQMRTQWHEGVALSSMAGVWQDTLLNVLVGKDLLPTLNRDWPNPWAKAREQAALLAQDDVWQNVQGTLYSTAPVVILMGQASM